MHTTIRTMACLAIALGSLPAAAAQDTTPVSLQMEAGAAWFRPWTSGTTYHSGKGYLQPFGAAEYYCGTGYAEAGSVAVDAAVSAWLVKHSSDDNPLLCIYRTAHGDLYALDVLVGGVLANAAANEHVDEIVNVVFGGTGEFAGATGVLTGTAQGRGELHEIRKGWAIPDSILKLMSGYLRLPRGRQ